MLNRRAKERHNRVAHIFVERSVVLKDQVCHRREVLVEEFTQCFCIELFTDGGKASNIRKEDGAVGLFPAELQLLRVVRT